MKSQIALIREAAKLIREYAIIRQHEDIGASLYALADSWDAAEPVCEVRRNDAGQVYIAWINNTMFEYVGAKLFLRPASDEVERLKAKFSAKEFHHGELCVELNNALTKMLALESQLSAIRQVVEKATEHCEYNVIAKTYEIPKGYWQILLNTIKPVVQEKRQYYYKVNACLAHDYDSPECICWHDEGIGPLASDEAKTWRIKPVQEEVK